jgi:excisionase family DNA binding protein
VTGDDQLAVSITKAAKMLDCSPATVRRAVERGDLRGVRLMGKLIIPIAELERHLGIERQPPSPEALVDAFAKLVGVSDQEPPTRRAVQP